MAESESLKDFLDRFVNCSEKDVELGYEIIDENTIITKHNKCLCGQEKNQKSLSKQTHIANAQLNLIGYSLNLLLKNLLKLN